MGTLLKGIHRSLFDVMFDRAPKLLETTTFLSRNTVCWPTTHGKYLVAILTHTMVFWTLNEHHPDSMFDRGEHVGSTTSEAEFIRRTRNYIKTL